MQKESALHILAAHKQRLYADYGITRLGIFGSVARDESEAGSDMDIIVEMPPDLFQMVHLKDDLESLFPIPIDLIRYHRFLNPYLKMRIDDEAIFI